MTSIPSGIEALERSEVVELNEIYAPERRKIFLRGIMLVYDMADEVMATTQQEGITNRATQVELAAPLVTQLRYFAMILSTFYSAVCFDGFPVTAELQETYDSAIDNFHQAYDDFLNGAETKLIGPLRVDEEVNPLALTIVEVVSVRVSTIDQTLVDD